MVFWEVLGWIIQLMAQLAWELAKVSWKVLVWASKLSARMAKTVWHHVQIHREVVRMNREVAAGGDPYNPDNWKEAVGTQPAATAPFAPPVEHSLAKATLNLPEVFGIIRLRAYDDRITVTVVLDKVAFQKAIGDKRVVMPDFPAGTPYHQVRDEVRESIMALAGKSATPVSKAKPAAKPVSTVKADLPVETSAAAPIAPTVPAAAPEATSEPVKPRKSAFLVSYTGQLLGAGTETREDCGKPFSCYQVKIADENLAGAVNQVWGADLERAIKESGAQSGDRIIVRFVGTTPVSIRKKGADGESITKTRDKKIFEIEVLKPAKTTR